MKFLDIIKTQSIFMLTRIKIESATERFKKKKLHVFWLVCQYKQIKLSTTCTCNSLSLYKLPCIIICVYKVDQGSGYKLDVSTHFEGMMFRSHASSFILLLL